MIQYPFMWTLPFPELDCDADWLGVILRKGCWFSHVQYIFDFFHYMRLNLWLKGGL